MIPFLVESYSPSLAPLFTSLWGFRKAKQMHHSHHQIFQTFSPKDCTHNSWEFSLLSHHESRWEELEEEPSFFSISRNRNKLALRLNVFQELCFCRHGIHRLVRAIWHYLVQEAPTTLGQERKKEALDDNPTGLKSIFHKCETSVGSHNTVGIQLRNLGDIISKFPTSPVEKYKYFKGAV